MAREISSAPPRLQAFADTPPLGSDVVEERLGELSLEVRAQSVEVATLSGRVDALTEEGSKGRQVLEALLSEVSAINRREAERDKARAEIAKQKASAEAAGWRLVGRWLEAAGSRWGVAIGIGLVAWAAARIGVQLPAIPVATTSTVQVEMASEEAQQPPPEPTPAHPPQEPLPPLGE